MPLTLFLSSLRWFLCITPEPNWHAPYNRMNLDIIIFMVHFWLKISKTSKSLKNYFYKIKSDQNQIFGTKIRPKGPDFGFGQITIEESQNFSKVEKSDFYWSEWLQNWSKCSNILKVLNKTIEDKLFWSLDNFL